MSGAVTTLSVLVLAAAAFAQQSTWLEVPLVTQVRAGCGAAAVAMVVQYWAKDHPELSSAARDTERIDTLLPASSKGIRGSELQRYLQKQGFDAYVFDGEVTDLQNHFAKGRPVVVCFAPGGPKGPLHYAVVVGVDTEAVWLNDSARGKLIREDLPRFLKDWKVTGNWALLAVPSRNQ